MAERIVQGGEKAEDIAKRKADRAARQLPDSAKSDLTSEDITRLFREVGLSKAEIERAKRDRGKPMP